MKLIFVTGGVISGLGKGITAASIGKLLVDVGYTVTMIKMDPYLNVDAGTMSPYEHGEVFVTEDGAETDLDLGHYERFINSPIHKVNSITTGKIYKKILENERKGKYLGKNIQIIPHVVNEVKEQILHVAKDYDFTIVEIGGTIGDIEGPHFIEAARQLQQDLGKQNVFYAHVVPVLYLPYSGEFKTKQIQHSYADLTKMGIQADMIMCRTEARLPQSVKDKLTLFCTVPAECIIENITSESIYEVPDQFQQQDVASIIQQRMGLEEKKADLSAWNNLVDQLLNSPKTVRVGIVGKYAEQQDSYISVIEALRHAGATLKTKIEIVRLQADEFEESTHWENIKEKIDGLLIPGGFGSRGMEGKIQAARCARERGIPYLGLCLGMQMAVIEYARNVCGIKDADTIESNPTTPSPVISFMPGQSEELIKGGSMRLGAYTTKLQEGSNVKMLYNTRTPEDINGSLISERHRHRYEVNPDYYDQLEKGGLTLSGRDVELGLVEFIEISDHTFFMATQAHPEFKSRLNKPHPLFVGFIDACMEG